MAGDKGRQTNGGMTELRVWHAETGRELGWFQGELDRGVDRVAFYSIEVMAGGTRLVTVAYTNRGKAIVEGWRVDLPR